MGRGGQNSASDSREEGKGLDRGKERAQLTKTNLEKAPLQNSWAPRWLLRKQVMHQGGGKELALKGLWGRSLWLWASMDLGVHYPAPFCRPHPLIFSHVRLPSAGMWGGDQPGRPKTPQSQTPS